MLPSRELEHLSRQVLCGIPDWTVRPGDLHAVLVVQGEIDAPEHSYEHLAGPVTTRVEHIRRHALSGERVSYLKAERCSRGVAAHLVVWGTGQRVAVRQPDQTRVAHREAQVPGKRQVPGIVIRGGDSVIVSHEVVDGLTNGSYRPDFALRREERRLQLGPRGWPA